MADQSDSSGSGNRAVVVVPIIVAVITVIGGIIAAFIGVGPWNLDRSPQTTTIVSTTTTTISKEQEASRKKRLLSVVTDQGIRATCSKVTDDHFVGALMVMECPFSGVPAVRVGLFPTTEAMYRVYNRAVEEARVERNLGSGDFCNNEPAEGSWSVSGGEPFDGRLFCHINDEGHVWFEWTYDKAKVLAYAYRRDDNFNALNRWWKNF